MTGGLCDVTAFGGNCLSDKAETKKLVLNFVDNSQDSMHLWYMCGVTCVNMQNLLFLFVHKKKHVLASYEVLNSFFS